MCETGPIRSLIRSTGREEERSLLRLGGQKSSPAKEELEDKRAKHVHASAKCVETLLGKSETRSIRRARSRHCGTLRTFSASFPHAFAVPRRICVHNYDCGQTRRNGYSRLQGEQIHGQSGLLTVSERYKCY